MKNGIVNRVSRLIAERDKYVDCSHVIDFAYEWCCEFGMDNIRRMLQLDSDERDEVIEQLYWDWEVDKIEMGVVTW